MKHLFYQQWVSNRVNKIVNIFGKNWFNDKNILELGAAHGDIGIEFLKLGSSVLFTDCRFSNLNSIAEKLKDYNYTPSIKRINQNENWKIDQKFDLILHLGTLYHLENWQQDLKIALEHSDLMILETRVAPKRGEPDNTIPFGNNVYGPINDIGAVFTQESVENELNNLGCKFIRFDDPDLNTQGWFTSYNKDIHIYNWTYDTIINPKKIESVHYRRFWLVIK